MARYCENCGVELAEESKFCQECGHNVEEVCPSCGHELENGANFCENCGENINEPPESGIAKKYRIAIVIALIAIIGVTLFLSVPMIIDYTSGTQIVDVDGYDFKIPGNFNESFEKSVSDDYGGVSKRWKNGDEYIEIWVLPSDFDAQSQIASLGGSMSNKYGYTGYHNIFKSGEEEFGFEKDNKGFFIFVSDSKLFDRIEVL